MFSCCVVTGACPLDSKLGIPRRTFEGELSVGAANTGAEVGVEVVPVIAGDCDCEELL